MNTCSLTVRVACLALLCALYFPHEATAETEDDVVLFWDYVLRA